MRKDVSDSRGDSGYLFIDNLWFADVWIIAAVVGNASLTPIN